MNNHRLMGSAEKDAYMRWRSTGKLYPSAQKMGYGAQMAYGPASSFYYPRGMPMMVVQSQQNPSYVAPRERYLSPARLPSRDYFGPTVSRNHPYQHRDQTDLERTAESTSQDHNDYLLKVTSKNHKSIKQIKKTIKQIQSQLNTCLTELDKTKKQQTLELAKLKNMKSSTQNVADRLYASAQYDQTAQPAKDIRSKLGSLMNDNSRYRFAKYVQSMPIVQIKEERATVKKERNSDSDLDGMSDAQISSNPEESINRKSAATVNHHYRQQAVTKDGYLTASVETVATGKASNHYNVRGSANTVNQQSDGTLGKSIKSIYHVEEGHDEISERRDFDEGQDKKASSRFNESSIYQWGKSRPKSIPTGLASLGREVTEINLEPNFDGIQKRKQMSGASTQAPKASSLSPSLEEEEDERVAAFEQNISQVEQKKGYFAAPRRIQMQNGVYLFDTPKQNPHFATDGDRNQLCSQLFESAKNDSRVLQTSWGMSKVDISYELLV